MEFQALFTLKHTKNLIKISFAAVVISALTQGLMRNALKGSLCNLRTMQAAQADLGHSLSAFRTSGYCCRVNEQWMQGWSCSAKVSCILRHQGV